MSIWSEMNDIPKFILTLHHIPNIIAPREDKLGMDIMYKLRTAPEADSLKRSDSL